MKMSKEISILLALLLGIGITLFLNKLQQLEVPEALKGMGGDFELQSQAGPVHLHDYRGKAVLVYFGYTHCPDVCPAALNTMAGAMKLFDQVGESRIAGLFISLDPRRDTPEVTGKFASFFDKRIVGLTGAPETLEQVAARWRVSYSVPEAKPGSDYAVEHSTFIYLVNGDGAVVDMFDEKTSPEAIANKALLWLQ